MVLVFLLPESRSTGSGIVNDFVWLMTSIVPSINQWAEGSKFPQLTQLYLSILWLVTPVMVWLLLKNINIQPREKHRRLSSLQPTKKIQGMPIAHKQDQQKRTTSKPVLILAGIFLFSLMLMIIYFPIFHAFQIKPSDYHSHSPDAFATLAPRQSKLWLGVLATVACGAVAFGIATFALLIGNCIFYIRFKFNSLFRK